MATLSELVNDFQGKIASIQQALKSPDAKTQSARLEQEIRSLYREIAVGLKHLNALHDSVKSLIDQYKSTAVSDDESKVMIRSFVETMRTDSLGSSTYVAEGWNQICSGEFEKAISSLSNAVKLNPNDTRALGLLGWAYSYQGMYDDGLAVCLKVLQLEPNNDAVRNNLGFISFKKGIFGEAIEHLSRVIKSGKDRPAVLYAHYYLGLVYLERQMLDDAMFFFSKATVLGPNLIEAYYHLGQVYYHKKMYGAALKEWEKCLKLSPHNWWAKKAAEQIELLKNDEV
ncbi:MAG: tetratricopeptide repeat protein [Candidatus Edwardsbacteria bacterium]|nr:tetratricopeptide repeat protein [Candidatus Edwardsbacteria bacterium]MBU1576696.1 tetratricopeptide repeat protein [Candidatus Edwardsbacteria bacterium]MBU2463460.1 tetratricopeptide repeat protein [Candidatus Edwardsbacteria bacterium]MBU2594012.1 tetratricopeptide repeat protein [Candidatus Edwardsbacteria bacterium]